MNFEELAQNLNLKRVKIRGDEIMASCPFPERHEKGTDKTPSFSINIDKGVFHCFSCGSSGTIEELVAKALNISVLSAMSRLEDWGFGKLDRELREKPKEKTPEVLPEGLLFYFDKIDNEFAETYSGDIDERDCLIYPVRRRDGKLVGAMARATKERWHKNLWHMNKKRYVYGEDLVELEKPLVVVEGAGDVIALRKAGITNVVALMGMNIADEQVEKLLSLSSEFIVWLDRDKAGAEGMNKIWKKMENRAKMRYVDPWKQVPNDCKDPRDVLEKLGPEEVQKIVKNSKTYLEHIMEDTL